MSFENSIQQWVTIDNQIKMVSDKLKELREKKNEVTEQINEHIETNNLSGTSISIGDSQIKFTKAKETQPLTFKFLENCLAEIIKNEEQVKKIIEYVKNKREVKEVSEIKRLYKN